MSKAVRYLAIETSSPRLSLAVGDDQRVFKDYQGPLEWRHAESLFEGMEKLLAQVGWSVQSLSGVIVSTGPGSFTGIRIGLATARALGQALNIPVVGLPSLKTLAQGVLRPGETACSLVDALRGDVFVGFYQRTARGELKTLASETRLPFKDLMHKLDKFRTTPLVLVGDALSLYSSDLRKNGKKWCLASDEAGYPQARALLELGAKRIRQTEAGSYQKVVPLYLRQAAAVERKK